MHKQRLKDIKAQVDVSPPGTISIQLSKGKRSMLEKERQYEIDKVIDLMATSACATAGCATCMARYGSLPAR